MRNMLGALLCLLPLPVSVWCQTAPEPKAVFEAASIKLDVKADGSDSEDTPGLLRAQMTLKGYIAYAYAVKDFQVMGGPTWVDREHYDITAKLERVDPQRPDGSQLREALQTLLADRFQLSVHHELKEVAGFALMADKGGFKLTPVADGGNHATSSRGAISRQLTASQVDMGRVAAFLARETGRPVEEQTHIPGLFTFTLEWARDDPKNSNSEQPELPSLFKALQEKLGLRLESRRILVDLLIVDKAERPSNN
jgi:uncharacterized protein (TIGR03435 family)